MFVVLSATVPGAPVMSDSEEEGSLGLEFGTESGSVSEVEHEETSAESKSAGKTVLEGGAKVIGST